MLARLRRRHLAWLVEGSYRVWVGVSPSLATAQAPTSELDLPVALGVRREFQDVAERVGGTWHESEIS
jgi:hypothetical protein